MMMDSLDIVRLSALLHDIGKPECWANRKPWSYHVDFGRKLLEPLFGGKVALTASRHHRGPSYSASVHPSTDEEWVIALADSIASGSDRPDQPEPGSPLPSPPIQLSHILSTGETVVHESEASALQFFTESFKAKFANSGSFEEVFDFLAHNLLEIPADTRQPNNDTSLWDHLRLTAAIANCMWRQGFKGRSPSKYDFALLSGDADRVGSYIAKSVRLPDLRARSGRIKQATEQAVAVIAKEMGVECVIYHGGGGFLSLTIPEKAEKLRRASEDSFTESIGGQATITVSRVDVNGLRIQRNFGSLWEEASKALRRAKLEKEPLMPNSVEEGSILCDVCRENVGTHESGTLYIDAAQRAEMLCNVCAKIREEGRTGRSLDEIKGKSNSIAVIRVDGDNIGSILDGTSLKTKFDKAQTPGRLATLSRLIHESCEKDMSEIIQRANGLTIFAGGDDVLAITSGEMGLSKALEIAERFSEKCAHEATASAGVAISDYRLPIYSPLEVSSSLLQQAKDDGRNGVAFAFLETIGGEGERMSTRSYEWPKFKELLSLVNYLKCTKLPSSQLRPLAVASNKSVFKAEVLIKYQMGGKRIPWDDGVKLLEYNESRLLGVAFTIYNYFKGGGMEFD